MLQMNLIGNLTANAVTRTGDTGAQWINLRIAAQYGLPDRQTGQSPTEFVDLTYSGNHDNLLPHLTTGRQVAVTAQFQGIREYPLRSGGTGRSIQGRVLSIDLLARPRGENTQQPRAEETQEEPELPF